MREIDALPEFFDFGDQFGLWLSLVERLPRVQEVQGSNPCSPIDPIVLMLVIVLVLDHDYVYEQEHE